MIDLHPEYLHRLGKPAFAVLPIEEFNRLQDYLQDLEDLLALRQAQAAEADASTIGLDELRRRLTTETP